MQLPNGDWLSYQFVFYDEVGDEEIYDTPEGCLIAAVNWLMDYYFENGLDALMMLEEVSIEESWFLSESSPDYDEDLMAECDESHTTNENVKSFDIMRLLDDFGVFVDGFKMPLSEKIGVLECAKFLCREIRKA